MLNWIVSPSCRLVSACGSDVSISGTGLMLLVVLTVIIAASAEEPNKASVAVEKRSVSFFIHLSGGKSSRASGGPPCSQNGIRQQREMCDGRPFLAQPGAGPEKGRK